MKGIISQRSGMTGFLQAVIKKRSAEMSLFRDAIRLQEQDMYNKGTVAVGDICNTADTLDIKLNSSLYFHNFVEVAGFVSSAARERFTRAAELHAAFLERLPAASMVPHAPYSVSDELMRMIDLHDPSSVLTIHNQESEEEGEFFLTGRGGFVELYKGMNVDLSTWKPPLTSSLQVTLKRISPEHSVILVHNVHTVPEDFAWIEKNEAHLPGLWWCFCPNANIYINGRLPDVDMFLRHTGKIVVGTDSLASNHQLNVLEELKTLQHAFPQLTTQQLLTWATINGAKALRIEATFGSFERGKQPGIVNITAGAGESLHGSISNRIL